MGNCWQEKTESTIQLYQLLVFEHIVNKHGSQNVSLIAHTARLYVYVYYAYMWIDKGHVTLINPSSCLPFLWV